MDVYAFLLYGSLTTIAISGFFVIAGIILIRFGYRDYHKGAMLLASSFALLFVFLYLTRSSLFPHAGYSGNYRTVYLATLWSHTALSVINLPMAAITLYLGMRRRFNSHKKIAPYTAGVWIYVALTGWLIHFFLR